MSKNIQDNSGAEKKKENEYSCYIYFHYNVKEKKQECCFHLETKKLFTVMNYELNVKGEKQQRELNLYLMGLVNKQTYLTEVSPASGKVYFNDLFGDYKVNVINSDKSVNSINIYVNEYEKELKIKEVLPVEKGKNLFCIFETAKKSDTFGKGLG
jgi:hypothetical protein